LLLFGKERGRDSKNDKKKRTKNNILNEGLGKNDLALSYTNSSLPLIECLVFRHVEFEVKCKK